MFKYPANMIYTTMTPKTTIEKTWCGMKFAPAPRLPNPDKPEQYGASLVIQYIEGYIYRTYSLYRANNNYIEALYNKAIEIESETNNEYNYFMSKGLALPRRCKVCRKNKNARGW